MRVCQIECVTSISCVTFLEELHWTSSATLCTQEHLFGSNVVKNVDFSSSILFPHLPLSPSNSTRE